jgi:hypothetical protein
LRIRFLIDKNSTPEISNSYPQYPKCYLQSNNDFSKEDQELKVKRKLDRLEEKGYEKARELYSILQNSDDKKERYLDYLSKSI